MNNLIPGLSTSLNDKFKELAKHLNKIAFLAIAHHEAVQDAASAKREYHLAWRRYESGDPSYGFDGREYWIDPEDRVTKRSACFEDACQATKDQYSRYQTKKRIAYNIKRRLATAVRGIHA